MPFLESARDGTDVLLLKPARGGIDLSFLEPISDWSDVLVIRTYKLRVKSVIYQKLQVTGHI